MFKLLGKFVTGWWAALLPAWVLALGLAWWLAPSFEEVVKDREFAFLPEDSPSRQGEEVFKQAFPQQFNPSNLVLVLRRHDGLSEQDKHFVKNYLGAGLERIEKEEGGPAHWQAQTLVPEKERPIIARIHTFEEPGQGALLISPDGKAMLVVMDLTSELLEHRNWSTLGKVDDLLVRLRQEGKVPAGLDIFQTGSAAIGRDITRRQVQSAALTTTTVLVVIILLLLMYRAPFLSLVPLLTVFVAVQLALRFLGFLASAGWVTLFEGAQVYITVIVYGAGVDYCFFLIARYREELEGGAEPRQAVAKAIGLTGPALTASAATVTLGIGMMVFARFGQFHNAGIAISSSLFLGLCAVLTFAPSLLRLCGRWIFWPRKAGAGGTTWSHPWWQKLAAALQRRPGGIWLGTVALMLPFATVTILNTTNLEFDLVKRLPTDAASLDGLRILKEHFPEGVSGPILVVIDFPGKDFEDDQRVDLIKTLTDRLQRHKKELGLADIRSLVRPLGITPTAQDALDELVAQQQLPHHKVESQFQKALDFYVGSPEVTQLQLILEQNPLARASLDRFKLLKTAIRANLPPELEDAGLYFVGMTASIQDLRVVTDNDQWRIESLVVACVFLVLVLLLRRPIVALYLIGSVLLCFLTTLGATFALFGILYGQGFTGLDWKVPIFLFTILVAVGEDYNIFLMTRIHEEQAGHGQAPGIGLGLVKTGPIITSCGIIMAGTFASLIPGTLVDLRQLGFALTFGVLLDTFVVRPVLVPAFLLMLQNGKGAVKKFLRFRPRPDKNQVLAARWNLPER